MAQIQIKKPSYPKFSLKDYQQNPTQVKRVNDVAFEYYIAVENERDLLRNALREKEDALLILKQATRQTNRLGMIQSFVLVIATVCLGFGINLATSSPYGLAGWLLSGAGVIFQIFGIIVPLFSRP